MHKILRLFANRLIVNDKHFLLNRENLTKPIQIQLFQKQKTFSEFLFAFSKSILNLNHSLTLIADVFPEVPTPKNMCKKPCFRGPLDRQHGKWVDTLLKSE